MEIINAPLIKRTKRLDEITLAKELFTLSGNMIVNQERINESAGNKDLQNKLVFYQITNRNKLKSVLKELLKEMEREELHASFNKQRR